MNQKQIGAILIIFGILIAGFTYLAKAREDSYINSYISEKGSCFLDSGKCLHEDRDYTLYVFGFAIALSSIIFGLYLALFDKTQETLARHQETVSKALENAKKFEKEKDEFTAFLSGFTEDEKSVISAIHEQDGILQSTLRYRTGITKASLSVMLKSLESRGIISRKEEGKSNKVFLRKKF